MKKYILTSIVGLILAITTSVIAQPPIPDTLWTRTYGGPGDEICYSVQQTNDGGYVLGGVYEETSVSQDDMYLIKTDRVGRIEWDRTYGGGSNECCKSVYHTSDGGYSLGGFTYSYGSGLADFYLVRTDSLGNQQWDQTYGTGYSDRLECMQPTSDGGYILGGYTGPPYGEDMYLVKTDSLGNLEWERTYGGNGIDGCYSVQQTSDGGYILGGDYGIDFSSNCDMFLVKTDAQGNLEFEQTFGGSEIDKCYTVRQTADGGYILGGTSDSYVAGLSDVYLVKTDSQGNLEWEQTFGGEYGDICYSVIQTPDNGYILGGKSGANVCVWKTDSLGNLNWEYLLVDTTGWEVCRSMDQCDDGSYILGGDIRWFINTNDDFYIVSLDGLQQAWVTLEPQSMPIVIPSGGGSFQFNVQLANCGTLSCTIDAWVMVTLPDSSVFGPVQGPVTITLPTGSSQNRDLTQYVPARAPAGGYSYNAYVGEYPNTIWHQDSFPFTKEGETYGQNAMSLSDWTISGWDYESAPAESPLPSSFCLFPPHPNPFNPTTTISFNLPVACRVRLDVFDISGRIVGAGLKPAPTPGSWYPPGIHRITFDGSNLASGIYIYRIKTGEFKASGKMVLMK